MSNFKLIGFTDSDWTRDINDRKSTSGSMFNLGFGVISWCSKEQEVFALSTSEVEYSAATAAACRAVWLRRLLLDLKQK